MQFTWVRGFIYEGNGEMSESNLNETVIKVKFHFALSDAYATSFVLEVFI